MTNNTLSLTEIQDICEKIKNKTISSETINNTYDKNTQKAINAIYNINQAKKHRECVLQETNNFEKHCFFNKYSATYDNCYTITSQLQDLKSLISEQEFKAYKTDLNDWAMTKANYIKEAAAQIKHEFAPRTDDNTTKHGWDSAILSMAYRVADLLKEYMPKNDDDSIDWDNLPYTANDANAGDNLYKINKIQKAKNAEKSDDIQDIKGIYRNLKALEMDLSINDHKKISKELNDWIAANYTETAIAKACGELSVPA